MDVLEMIDKIEELLERSKRIPFSSSIVIRESEIYDTLDELRNIIPEEVKRQSVKIIQQAEEKAEKLVDESDILKKANRKADEVISIAEAKARTIRLEAEDYADEKLASLEAVLYKIVSAVERGREQFKAILTTKNK